MTIDPMSDLTEADARSRFIDRLVFTVIGKSPTEQGRLMRPLINAARASTPSLAGDAAFEQWEAALVLEVIARLERIGEQATDGVAGRA
ncbi:hypothetical protein FNL55_00375 [Tardiphaga sp. vice352]|uniref:hypothetical protein n=1 Tax=unclassified Tardiphaga TaxID=2631404 RepID=UPI001164C6DE|nr:MULTISPECIES: hypothetical protein [unclassified Tardiphaga]QDM14580.1 hypothetical protein FNL53_00380 [Tardiphaga sp. vice278]QDM29968.1 hypothetical protein FNL55_00375 [Tardiphaga sp. vice352]